MKSPFDIADRYLEESPGVDLSDADILALRIYSSVLEDECWLILREGFEPDDGLVVYRVDEFPLIIGKSPAQLRAIHEVKKTFGGGRVMQ